jgi:signal peptidase I
MSHVAMTGARAAPARSGGGALRATLGWGGQVLAWLIILAVGAALVVAVLIPRVAGATPYTILTGSMRPGMPPGTLVVVRPTNPADIRVGDVMTYQIRSGDPTVVTHRVIAQRVTTGVGYEFRTRGDANDVADAGWIRPVQIKGTRWYAIPYLGYVNELVSGHERQWAVYVVAAVLLVYAGSMFGGAWRDRRRSRATSSDDGGGTP